MDVASISDFITTLGFPIVMCVMLYSRMIKQDEKHEEEIKQLSTTIQNNTIALTSLTAKLEQKGVIQ